MLKSIRVFFSKRGRLKFISHLDMNRLLTRAVRKAKIPIWYTEGFHPRPYIAIALPLSLGFVSDFEILDLKISDDALSPEKVCDDLNAVCPEDIRFFGGSEPVLKPSEIGFAAYEITFDDGGQLYEKLSRFSKKDSIICSKKTKKGDIKEFDIVPDIKEISVVNEADTTLKITLPAGSDKNLNPELLLNAFYAENGDKYFCYTVNRTAIFDKKGLTFK